MPLEPPSPRRSLDLRSPQAGWGVEVLSCSLLSGPTSTQGGRSGVSQTYLSQGCQMVRTPPHSRQVWASQLPKRGWFCSPFPGGSPSVPTSSARPVPGPRPQILLRQTAGAQGWGHAWVPEPTAGCPSGSETKCPCSGHNDTKASWGFHQTFPKGVGMAFNFGAEGGERVGAVQGRCSHRSSPCRWVGGREMTGVGTECGSPRESRGPREAGGTGVLTR